jgi:hypothetical protein
MNHILIVALFFVGGIIVGIVLHKTIVGQTNVAKSEIAGWTTRLRASLTTDVQVVKTEVMAVIQDIERKL